MKDSALRRRIAPSVPLRLELKEDDGKSFIREFRLCFDFNAAARIKEKTGVSVLNFVEAWSQIIDPRLVSTMFWAAILANNPEYNTFGEDGKPTDEGLEVIRSYMDDANSEQILEALWSAYLLSLSKEKREAVQKIRKDAEANRDRTPPGNQGNPPVPLSVPAELPTTAKNGSGSGQSQDMISDLVTASSAV